jgi:hypothetical protein
VSYRGFDPLDLIGQRRGRLLVCELTGKRGREYLYLCKCDCGAHTTVVRASLTRRRSMSCGCLRLDRARDRNILHGGNGTAEYRTWLAMKSRCNNQRAEKYSQYGGRGISICSRWTSFTNFLEDMGPRPTGMMIERIDNDGNYTPGNCRWATPAEQGRNKRNNRIITHDGRTMCMAAWAEEVGISYTVLRQRLHRGWSIDRALGQGPTVTRGD